jgi:Bacterial Ig-like domain (group 3)
MSLLNSSIFAVPKHGFMSTSSISSAYMLSFASIVDGLKGRTYAGLASLLLMFILATLPANAEAATKRWTGATNGLWSNAGNWSPAGAPQAGDDVVFSTGAVTTSVTNDIQGLSLASISMERSGYTISGNTVILTRRFEGIGGNTFNIGLDLRGMGIGLFYETFNGPIEINAAQTGLWDGKFNGTVNVRNYSVYIGGAVLSGQILGTGVLFTSSYDTDGFIYSGTSTTAFSGEVYGDTGLYLLNGSLPGATVREIGVYGSGRVSAVIFGDCVPGIAFTNSAGLVSGSTGTITTNIYQDANLLVQINGVIPGDSYSQVVVNNSITLVDQPNLMITLAAGFTAPVGQVFRIVDNRSSAAVVGSFGSFQEGSTIQIPGGYEFTISYRGGDGNDVTLTLTKAPRVWRGGAGPNWSTAANWVNGVPQTGDIVSFPETASSLVSNNDLVGISLAGLVFAGRGYTLGGNAIILTGSASSVGGNTVTARLEMRGASTQYRSAGANPQDQLNGLVVAAANGVSLIGASVNGGLDVGAFAVIVNSSWLAGTLSGTGRILLEAFRTTVSSTGSFSGTINCQLAILNRVSLPAARFDGSLNSTAFCDLSGNGAIGGTTTRVGLITPAQTDAQGVFLNGVPAVLEIGTIPSFTSFISGVNVFARGTSAGVDYGQIRSTGQIFLDNLSSRIFFNLQNGFTPLPGQVFTVLDNRGTQAVNGTFSGLAEGAVVSANNNANVRLVISYRGGDGNDVTLTAIGALPSATTVSATPNPVTRGQSVTLRATVTVNGTSPSGTVVFSNGATSLGSSTLSNGAASLTTSFATAGNYAITARYSGDTSYTSSSGSLAGGLTVNNPAVSIGISPNSVPNGTAGAAYAPTLFIASGGASPYTYSVSSGTLPFGLSLSNAGVLSGTPSTAGSFTFTVRATDLNGATGFASYSATISQQGLLSQTIQFSNPGQFPTNSIVSLNASASSSLPVTFTSSTVSVCNIAGAQATLIVAGICTITASQPGNTVYAAATPVTVSFSVATQPLDPPTNLICVAASQAAACTFVPSAAVLSSAATTLFSYTLTCSGTNLVQVVSPSVSGTNALRTLSISGLQAGATYTCMLRVSSLTATSANSASSNLFTVLAAAIAPPPPALNRVIAGNGQATVAFTRPSSDGSGAITRFTAVAVGTNISASCNAPCSSIVVTGLTNGTPYTFVVLAVNAAGNGLNSAVSGVVTPLASLTNRAYPAPLAQRGGAIDPFGTNQSRVFVYGAGNLNYLGAFNGVQFQWLPRGSLSVGDRVLGIGDFDGNGMSDYAYQSTLPADSPTGSVQVSPFSLGTESASRGVKREWIVQTVADLDGDGVSDMVFRWTGFDPARPQDTGVSYIWFMKSGALNQVRKRGGAPLDWKLLGAADINGDFAADMVYVSPENQVRVLMATPNRTCANIGAGSLPFGFQALTVSDFQANGRAAILARNPNTGVVILHALDARNLTLPAPTADPDNPDAPCTSSSLQISTNIIEMPRLLGWTFYASGDFNGDGFFDVAWVNSSGQLILWLMGPNTTNPVVIPNAGMTIPNAVVLQP